MGEKGPLTLPTLSIPREKNEIKPFVKKERLEYLGGGGTGKKSGHREPIRSQEKPKK